MSEPDSCFAVKPWSLKKNEEVLFRHYLNLRYRLQPYIYSAAIEGHLTGRPILGSLVWDYQNDEQVYQQDYEFMFGRNMLVAPVICKEKVYATPVNEWNVYLPANSGRWIHYWSGQKFDAGSGKTITVSAPLEGKDGLPLFVKEGAIIPMMPLMQYTSETTPDPITLEIFPKAGSSTNYTYYDSETGSKLLPSPSLESYTSTLISCDDKDKEIVVTISESERSYELSVHLDKIPGKVLANGKIIPVLADMDAYNKASEGFYLGPDNIRGTGFSIQAVYIKFSGAKGLKHKIQISK
jgi:alpha-glucosidase (family GH31 glycosyl hydrolase)